MDCPVAPARAGKNVNDGGVPMAKKKAAVKKVAKKAPKKATKKTMSKKGCGCRCG
jgi:hypothetical protein